MPPERVAGMELLDCLDEVMQRHHPGRKPMTDGQRHVILAAFADAAPFSAEQRLRMVRLLRNSEHWTRLRASAQRGLAS